MKKSLQLDNFIWVCFACWILIDSFNGYAKTNEIGIPVSQIFKTFVFVIVLIRLIRYVDVQLILFFCFLYIVLVLSNITGSGDSTIGVLTQLMKPLTNFFFFIYFVKCAQINRGYFARKFDFVIVFSFVFFIANVFLGLLGFGNSIYALGDGESYGIKGFIYAQNEISGVVAVLFPLVLLRMHRNYGRQIYYMTCLFLIFISFSIATKAAVFVAILSSCLVSFYLGEKKEKKVIVIITAISLIAIISYISYILASDFGMFQRFSYFYEKNGFYEAILSGRWTYWMEQSPYFFRQDFITQLFGLGNSEINCELDPFDALLYLGWIGLLFNVLFLGLILIIPGIRKNKNEYEKVMFISNSLIFFIAILSGHIFFSSMAGMLIALSNAFLIDNRKELLIKRILIFIIAKKLQIKVQTQ